LFLLYYFIVITCFFACRYLHFFFRLPLSVLFLSLARKKKTPKRKGTVCTSGATPEVCRAKGQELAALKQPVLPDARQTPSALRPCSEAGEPCGVF